MTDQQSAVLQPSAESRDSISTAPNTHYWRQLGLEASPFEGEAEPYFEVDQHQAYFAQLDQFRQSAHSLLLVPCIVGSGKTSILQQYMAIQHEILGLHYLRAQSSIGLPQLVQQVFLQQGDANHLSNDFRQIIFQLTEYTRAQGAQLLIIDDAQCLSKDTLSKLLQFLVQLDLKQCGFRVVLSGEPQLEDRVNTLCETLELDLLATTLNIQAYAQSETREYLHHRLKHVGFQGRLPFTGTMVKHIHSLSGGYPGRINRVAQQVLVDHLKDNDIQLEGGESLFERLNQHKIKVLSLVLLSVFFWALWQGKQQGQLNWFVKAQPHIITAPVARPLPAVPKLTEAKAVQHRGTAMELAIALSEQKHLIQEAATSSRQQVAENTHAVSSQLDVQTRVIDHPVIVKKIRDKYRPGAVISNTKTKPQNAMALDELALVQKSAPVKTQATVKREAVVAVEKEAKKARVVVKSAAKPKATEKAVNTAVALKKPQVVKKAKIAVKTVNTPVAHKKLRVAKKAKVAEKTVNTPVAHKKHRVTKKAKVALKPVTKPKAVAQAAQITPAFTLRHHRRQSRSLHHRIDKLLAGSSIPPLGVCEHRHMNAEGFTLQLMGAHDAQRLADFVKGAHMHKNMLVFHSTFDGQPWYVLTYGRYESAEAAHASVRRLPTVVQAQHPWIRSAHSIQKAIQQL